MKTRVLVTGANGQLGRTIKELYEINDYNIEFVFVTKTELDITEEEKLHRYFEANSFDYCINCAAYTDVEQAEKTPEIAFKVNAEGVKYLAEACKKNKAVLVHISTDYVFDGEKETPYTIDDEPNPINEYGKSKMLGEQFIREDLENFFIIRTSWLYSTKYGNNFYNAILKKARTDTELFVTDQQVGCPTNAENLANYILKLLSTESTHFGIKHFTDDVSMTWYCFAEGILKRNNLYDKVKLVKAGNYRTFARRPKNSVLKS